MKRRTLVITLGQLRAHQLTWNNFKENVLDQLDADLAVCVPDDTFFDRTNTFYVNARFRWLIPDASDLAGAFDRIQKTLGAVGRLARVVRRKRFVDRKNFPEPSTRRSGNSFHSALVYVEQHTGRGT